MSRAHYRIIVRDSAGNSQSGAMVYVYNVGTAVAISDTIYSSYTGAGTLSNPLTSDANGIVEFFLDRARDVKLAGPAINTVEVAGVTTPHTERLGWYNPLDYGAKGDGTTDDQAAVQACLDAINTAGGGTMYLPGNKKFYCATAVTCYSNTHIRGDGRGSQLVIKSATNDLLVANSGATGIAIDNICFMVDGVKKTAGVTLKLQGNRDVFLTNIWWDGKVPESDRHFRCLSSTGLTRNLVLSHFEMTAISDTTDACGIYIKEDSTSWGYYFSDGSIHTAHRTTDGVEYTTKGYAGVIIEGIDGCRFIGVEIVWFYHAAVILKPAAAAHIMNTRFVGCAIEGAYETNGYALRIEGTSDCQFWDLLFEDCTFMAGNVGATVTYGILVDVAINVGQTGWLSNLHFTNCIIHNQALVQRTGTHTALNLMQCVQFENCRINSGQAANYALTFNGNVDGFGVNGCTIGSGTGHGIQIQTSTTDITYRICDNNFGFLGGGTTISDLNTGAGRKTRLGNIPKTANMLVTRTEYYPADAMRDGMDANVTKALLGATEAYQMPVLAYADGGDGYATFSHRVNADFVSGMKARLEWGANANTGNVHWALHYKFIADAASMVDASGTADLGGVAVPGTVNYLKETQSAILSTGAAASRLFRLAVRRYHDASDTLVGIAYLAGVELEWQEYAD